MRVGIFGAGQAGLMVSRWLPGHQKLVCYIDNNIEKQGGYLENIPICSLEEALTMNLDVIWVAILNKEAERRVEVQVRHTTFCGLILRISDYKDRQDLRLSTVRLIAEEIKKRKIPGAIAELGVYQGNMAKELNQLFPDRKLYLFDTFEGFEDKDLSIENILSGENEDSKDMPKRRYMDFSDTSMELVKERLPYPEQAFWCKGYFPNSLDTIGGSDKLPKFSLVSLDPDLYAPVYHGLNVFYPRLSPGGAIVIHDYNSIQFPGVKKAVERFCEEQQVYVVPMMDLHGSAILMKQR